MPVPTNASFIGLGKESVRGTAVAATDFIPVRAFNPHDIYNYQPDKGNRGSAVENYDEIGTQAWSEHGWQGDVFVDTIGHLLYMLLGEVATTGPVTSVYTHNFNVLNTAPMQPPSYTVADYAGLTGANNARQYPGFIGQSLELRFNATNLLEYTFKGMGFKSAKFTKPTPSFTTEVVKPAWQGATTLGGGATSLLQEGSLTISRTVVPILSINGTQDPYQMWAAGNLSVAGKLLLVYEADTELDRYTGSTNFALDINFNSGTGATQRQLKLHCSKGLYRDGSIERGKSFSELNLDFEGVGNTTDVGASGGYSPVKVTLISTKTAY